MNTLFTSILVGLISCIQAQNKQLHYLALGDSYTCGQSVKQSESWPAFFGQQINSIYGHKINKNVIAKTGWRSDELIAALQAERLKKHYDIISIQIGVNNQFQGKDSQQFRKDLEQLFSLIKKFTTPETLVFVLSIPDYSFAPSGKKYATGTTSKMIAVYNKMLKDAAKKHGVPFISINEIHDQTTVDKRFFAIDGLHPSGLQYQLWVEKILPVLNESLLQL